MKYISFLISFLFLSTSITNAQQNSKFSERLIQLLEGQSTGKTELVWIYFTDKGGNTEAYYSNPTSVVSPKSLERRKKVLPENNLLKETDLPVFQEYITAVEQSGILVKHPSRWLNAISTWATRGQLEEISMLPFVKRIDFVNRYGNQEPFVDEESPGDDGILQQPEGVNSLNYGSSFTQNDQINVPAVHDMGFYGQGVTICVLDAGFNRLTHETFDNMNIIAAWDFVNNDPDVGDGSDMGSGSHGTKTLSTIGGYTPGELIGPAFGSDYILAKTENTDSETPVEEDNWVAALEWADSIGVDVTSTSLGYLDYDYPFNGYTWMDMDGNTAVITIAADIAVSLGIVVVNSAGNEGYHSTQNTLIAPSDGDSVICVGGVTSSGTRSSFSSVGPTYDGRIKPDIMAMGSNVRVASSFNDDGYTNADGTSFSCPLSAGVAALILSFNPDLTPMEVRDALRTTSSNSENPNREYGWGIINALAALEFAITPDVTPPDPVTDLMITQTTSDDMRLSWTVPHDTTIGGVVAYDLRYSTSPITDTNDFNSALPLEFPGKPDTTGAVETLDIDSLDFSTVYYFAIRCYDYFQNISTLSNVAMDTTLAAPVMSVEPDSIYHIMHNQTLILDTILISNISDDPSTLDFSVMLDNHVFPDERIQAKIIPLANDLTEVLDTKENPVYGGGQSIEGAGGPDNYGYSWIDSDEPGGPNFVWNDISTTGTVVTNWIASGTFSARDEGYAGPFDLGFLFDFYGIEKTEVYVATNGLVLFSPLTSNIISNDPIPDDEYPNEYIAPFWDDLEGTDQGEVYYQQDGNKFIIQFDEWQRYPGLGTLTFQVVLYSSGKIMIYYKTMAYSDLSGCTVGIENQDASDGLQISYNSTFVKSNFAVEIASEPDWLVTSMLGGRLFNNNSAVLQLTLYTEDFPQGDYSMDVIINSNDPANAQTIVPVMLALDNSVPPLYEPIDGSSEMPLNVLLYWGDAEAQAFHLQIATDAEFSATVLNDSTLTDSSYFISGLDDGTQYFWRVRGINNGEAGHFSPVRTFSTYLPAPEDLNGTAPDLRTLEIDWTDRSQNESGFIIERKEGEEGDPGSYAVIDTIGMDMVTYRDSSGLQDSSWYTYRVRAFNNIAQSEYSHSISLRTPVPVGVEEEAMPVDYALLQNYPNPFNPSTVIRYALPKAGLVRLHIYNALGELVAEAVNGQQPAGYYEYQFDAAPFSSGIYFYALTVHAEDGSNFNAVKKMILMK